MGIIIMGNAGFLSSTLSVAEQAYNVGFPY